MSQNATSPPSRPPSSSSSVSSNSSNLPRVHGHDHTRPLPPPRLLETSSLHLQASPRSVHRSQSSSGRTTTSSSSSFRSISRTPLRSSQESANLENTSSLTASSRFTGPRVPTTTTATTTTTPEASRTPASEVTLSVPRPDGDRIGNEYVDTPFRPTALTTNPRDRVDAVDGQKQSTKNERRSSCKTHQTRAHRQNRVRHNNQLQQLTTPSSGQAITKQPVSFTKEPANAVGPGTPRSDEADISIICEYCSKCRCESCRDPPRLPSRWLCNDTCYCSAETALDYASCLCCVKGLFYHCADSGGSGESDAGGNCADEPCSCTGSRKTARWTCLGALSLVLPCLLCYWPLKACVTVCETCYANHATQGCRCDPTTTGRHHVALVRDSRDPEKRLLDPITPEL